MSSQKSYGRHTRRKRTLQSSVELSPTAQVLSRSLSPSVQLSPHSNESQLSPLRRSPRLNRPVNKFFVESKDKPQWPAVVSPSVSPKKHMRTPNSPRTPVNLTANASPRKQVLSNIACTDSWEFLEEHSTSELPRKSLKLSLKSPRKKNEHRELIQFFNKLPSAEHEQKEVVKEVQELLIKRSLRTYGDKRSYRLQKDDQHNDKQETSDHSDDDQEPGQENNDCSVKNFSDLKAQGSHNQHKDEIDFLLEGIYHSQSLTSLMELSLKLQSPEFQTFFRSMDFDVPIDDDPSKCYVLGHIIQHQPWDPKFKTVVTVLLQSQEVTVSGSKMTKQLFKEWSDSINLRPFEMAISIMFTNHTIDEDLFIATAKLFDKVDDKSYDKLLILYEAYFQHHETGTKEIDSIVTTMMKRNKINDQTTILTVKLLIILSIKKHSLVTTHRCIDKYLTEIQSTSNEEIQTLIIGLFINLIEHAHCFEYLLTKIRIINSLFTILHHNGYICLLIGMMFVMDDNVKHEFEDHDWDQVVLGLQKFDKSNDALNGQIEGILDVINR